MMLVVNAAMAVVLMIILVAVADAMISPVRSRRPDRFLIVSENRTSLSDRRTEYRSRLRESVSMQSTTPVRTLRVLNAHRRAFPVARARSPCGSPADHRSNRFRENAPQPLRHEEGPATDQPNRHQNSTGPGTSPTQPSSGMPRKATCRSHSPAAPPGPHPARSAPTGRSS
jgi:hypothetical protein